MNSTLVVILARVILLLLIASLVNLALRRRSASLRGLVWTIALGGILLLPLLSRITPRIQLVILPAAATAPDPVAAAGNTVPLTRTAAKSKKAEPTEPAAIETIVLPSPQVPAKETTRIPWTTIALLSWATGCTLLLLRLIGNFRSLGRIVETSQVPTDPEWSALVDQVRRELGIRRSVPVRMSDIVAVPAVAGVFRPVLLLPADAYDWGSSDRRQVVLHELAHVVRWDGLSQLVTQLACAVYWFVPLVWYGARRAAQLRELACDDVVLRAGTRASTYAENLLRLVRGVGVHDLPPAALAMARTSRLTDRVKGILDPDVRRDAVSGRATVSVMALAGIFFGLIAAADPSAPASRPFASSNVVNGEAGAGVQSAGHADAASPRVRPSFSVLLPGLTDTTGLCGRGVESNSNSINESDDHPRSWTVKMSGTGCKVEMRVEGKVEFNDDFTGVKSISNGGFFRLDVTDRGLRRQLEIEPRNGALERTYRVNGNEQPWDEAGRQWFASFLIELDRRTAVAVDIRLPRLLRQGGVSAVLNETGLMPSDYARSQYYTKLAATTRLSNADVKQILDQSVALKTSDYYSAELLKAFLGNGVEDAAMREAVLGMASKMTSDYYRAEAMNTLLASGKPTPAEMSVLLSVTGRMESSYYQGETLKKILALGTLTSDQRAMVATAVAGMKDDFQVAEVLKALAASGEMGAGERKAFFDALGGVQSDYYLYEITNTILTDRAPSADEADLVIRAAGNITSDYYRGEIAGDLLAASSLTEAQLLRIVDLVRPMESDFTKGNVLQKILRHRAATSRVRDTVLDVASKMSNYYRGEVRQAAGRGDI